MRTILFAFLCPFVLAAPEQVHLSFQGNYSVMAVVWTTFKKDNSTVLYGTSPNNLQFSAEGTQNQWLTGNITRYSHRALMKNLLPSTAYWYKIDKRSFQFKTLSEYPGTYRACIFGDLGRHHGNSTASILRDGMSGMFDFIVHIGRARTLKVTIRNLNISCDISYDLQSDDGVNGDKFMNQLEPVISRIPYMVVAGNHEYEDGNFTNFRQRFWMPPNDYEQNQFYSFDLGPVHWVALSTEYYGYYEELGKQPILAQYNWLVNDLKSANSNRHQTPWIATFSHRPYYCSAAHNDDCSGSDSSMIRVGYDDLPGLEKPFLDYGVDLGFWGHVHYYERFYPVANGKYWNSKDCYHNPAAPTYIITGSAGCHSSGTKFDKHPVPFSAKRLNDYGYTILTVANATHIHIQQLSIDENEAIVDDFWLSKDQGLIDTKKMSH